MEWSFIYRLLAGVEGDALFVSVVGRGRVLPYSLREGVVQGIAVSVESLVSVQPTQIGQILLVVVAVQIQ